jgi:hypothetical protein
MAPKFWERVRLFNWIAGAIGLAASGWLGLGDRDSRPRPREHRLFHSEFSPDSRSLIADGVVFDGSERSAELDAWDVATGRRLWTRSSPGIRSARSSILPDGSTVVTAAPVARSDRGIPSLFLAPQDSATYQLQFRDLRTGQLLQSSLPTPHPLAGPIREIDIAPTGRTVAVTFADRVAVWEAVGMGSGKKWQPAVLDIRSESGTFRDSLHLSADGVNLVALRGRNFFRSGRNGEKAPETVRWVEIRSARTGATLRTTRYWVSSGGSLVSPDRCCLLAMAPHPESNSTGYMLWDLQTDKVVQSVRIPGWSHPKVHFVIAAQPPPGKPGVREYRICVRTNGIYNWDTRTNLVHKLCTIPRLTPTALESWSPDGRFSVTYNRLPSASVTHINDALTGIPLRPLEAPPGHPL